MQICLLNDSNVYAGTESHVFTLSEALNKAGMPTVIACPPQSPLSLKAQASRIKTIGISKCGLIDRAAIRAIIGLLKSKQIHIVHTHNGRTHLNAALAVSLARRGKCIATQHFIEPNHAMNRCAKALVYRQAHRWVNSRTAHFIAISHAVRRAMLLRGDAAPEAITVVPNGISEPDLDRLALPSAVRSELLVPQQAPLIISTARLEREKDIASLVAAMMFVVRKFPDARCIIVGQGSLKHALASQISKLGLDESVRLLGFREDAPAIMRAADVFVLPSLAEPFGLVLLEAMALSRPVVATGAGGPAEIVVDGKTGLLVPPAQPALLSQAILRLLEAPEEARRMGKQGRARFHARFTATQMAKATKQLYQSVPTTD